MEIRHILGALTILIYFICLLCNKYSIRVYLLFVLYFLPFLDLSVTPEKYGSITVFDTITFFNLVLFFKEYLSSSRVSRLYLILFYLLVPLLFVGCVNSEFVPNSFMNLLKFLSILVYGKFLI